MSVLDPRTHAEWREAVDLASFLLHVDSALQYGLIEGGPVIDVERCQEILELARARGFTPRPIRELVAEAFGGG